MRLSTGVVLGCMLCMACSQGFAADPVDTFSSKVFEPTSWQDRGRTFEGVLVNVLDDHVIVLNVQQRTQHKIARTTLTPPQRRLAASLRTAMAALGRPLSTSGLKAGVDYVEGPADPAANDSPLALTETVMLKGGKKHGRRVEKAPNGAIYTSGMFNDDNLTGLLATLFPTGEVYLMTVIGDDGSRLWTFYYRRDGTLATAMPFLNDKVNGTKLDFFANGVLAATSTVEDDVLHGTVVNMLPNGQVCVEAEWRQGRMISSRTIREPNARDTTAILSNMESLHPAAFFQQWTESLGSP